MKPKPTTETHWLIDCGDCCQVASMILKDDGYPLRAPQICPACGSSDLCVWPVTESGEIEYMRPGGKRPPMKPADA